MSVYETLSSLGIALAAAAPPAGAFAQAAQSGKLIFTSGHIAKQNGKPLVGKLGAEFTTQQGSVAARDVAIDLISTLHVAVGDLGQLKRIVKLMVLVNSTPSFTEQHLVANGASQLFQQVFGENGVHARSAFGVAQIPFGSCVEIDVIAELR